MLVQVCDDCGEVTKERATAADDGAVQCERCAAGAPWCDECGHERDRLGGCFCTVIDNRIDAARDREVGL